MTWGLIARTDQSGIGQQTREWHRHMHPDRTLALDFGRNNRGASEPYAGDGVTQLSGYPTEEDAARFMDGLDLVASVECLYLPTFTRVARRLGVEVLVQANAELYDPYELDGARVVLPTAWMADRVPHERILPVPVATDRFAGKVRTAARVFYHPGAPAMLDRNGTDLVRAALPYVQSEVTVIIRDAIPRVHGVPHSRPAPRRVGDHATFGRGALAAQTKPVTAHPPNVTLIELGQTEDPYWSAYPADADVLLLPRRYGGLSLSAQEAAALGMPAIMSALSPQNEWPHVLGVRTSGGQVEAMKAGPVTVYDIPPEHIAAAIDHLATNPDLVAALSRSALGWAHSLSWGSLTGAYRDCLRLDLICQGD